MTRWQDVEALLVDEADRDLRAHGEVNPALAAFRGGAPLFLAWLRPFAKGAYAEPLIELFALAMPLGADRLALSMAGRAWSFDDPVPPVTAGADLRQRVLIVYTVDGTGAALRPDGVLHPFDLVGRTATWQPARRMGAGEGWIPRALALAVRERRQLGSDDDAVRAQAVRVRRLGHTLALEPTVAWRLRLDRRLPSGRLSGRPRDRRAR